MAAVEKAGVANMIWFNYRRVPAIALARQLVDEGRVGRTFHYRATYNQDWTIAADVPQGGQTLWRLELAAAGSGVTGDLLAHSIDTAEWLNGPIRASRRQNRDVHQAAGACRNRQRLSPLVSTMPACFWPSSKMARQAHLSRPDTHAAARTTILSK